MNKICISAVRCLSTERWLLLKKDNGLWCFPEAETKGDNAPIICACESLVDKIEITNINLLCIVTYVGNEASLLHLYFSTTEEECGVNLKKPFEKFAWMDWESMQNVKNASPCSDFAMRVFEKLMSDA